MRAVGGARPRWCTLALTALCATVLPAVAVAQGAPHLVKNINRTGIGVDASGLTLVGGRLMYAGHDAAAGTELWSSDGTAAGTGRVADIRRGAGGSQPEALMDADGVAFFVADDGVQGPELWRSDRTAAGTSLVMDINPGGIGSRPYSLAWCRGAGLLFFAASDGVHGWELWASDGTKAGTRLVRDIAPGEDDAGIGAIVAAGDHVLFGTWSELTGAALWRSDGTAQGTFLLRSFGIGSDLVGSPLQDLAYWPALQRVTFVANDGVHGYEPWVSDGTADGTLLLGDLNPGGDDSFPSRPVAYAGALYFLAASPAYVGRLWRTDGTAAGTGPVAAPFGEAAVASLGDLAVLGDRLVFVAAPWGKPYELWQSDGSALGTVPIVRFAERMQPYGVQAASGRVFFIGYSWGRDGTGYELWTSDGTADGTHIVKDIFAGPVGSEPKDLVTVGGTVFFTAHDEPSHGRVLWRSDGTPEGTAPVADDAEGPDASALYTDLVAFGDELVFAAYDTGGSSRLWQSDGTPAGTLPVAATDALLDVRPPHPLNGQLIVWGDDGVHGGEPWRTDTSAAGTSLLADIIPGFSQSYDGETGTLGSTLFFTVSPDDFDDGSWELWATDGTAPGTRMVKRIDAAPESGEPTELTALGGAIYFSAADLDHGRELWRSDGTAAGTVLVKDIAAGKRGSAPEGLTQLDGRIYFFANDRVHGRELWQTHGSEAGTTLVLEINPGPPGLVEEGYAIPHLAFGHALYFAADDGEHGTELWRTCGSAADTVLVKDIAPGVAAGDPRSFAVVGGRLMFSAAVPGGGSGLWSSDGTGDGTVLVSDACRSPRQLTDVNGIVYFNASDETHGEELWKSDGSAAGTTAVADILPGPGRSSPTSLLNLHGQLFFIADDGQTGRELWGLTCGNAVVEAGEECDDGPGNGTSSSCCRGDCRLRHASARGAPCTAEAENLLLSKLEIRPSGAAGAGDGTISVRGTLVAPSALPLLDVSRRLDLSVEDGVGMRAKVHWAAGRCRPTRGAGFRCSDRAARHVAAFVPEQTSASGTSYRLRITLRPVHTARALAAPARLVLRQLPQLDRRGSIAACAVATDGTLSCGSGEAP